MVIETKRVEKKRGRHERDHIGCPVVEQEPSRGQNHRQRDVFGTDRNGGMVKSRG